MAASCAALQALPWTSRVPSSRQARRQGRPLVVAAAARGGSGGGGASTGGTKQQQLVRALVQATRKQVLDGSLADLVLPLVSDDTGAREPPPATVPPQQLVMLTHFGQTCMASRCITSRPGLWAATAAAEAAAMEAAAMAAAAAAAAQAQALASPPSCSSTASINLQLQGHDAAAGRRDGVQASALPRCALVTAASCRRAAPDRAPAAGSRSRCLPTSGGWDPTLARRRVIAFDRPPFGLAERPLEWGRPGDRLSYNPYTIQGSARLTAGALVACVVA